MAFNENSRVKIPAILHLCRLGYTYLTLKNAKIDATTNIFTDLFSESIQRLNPNITPDEAKRLFDKISLVLDYEDLGEAFYQLLTDQSEIKLIDFADFNNNSFHVVTELTYKNGEDEFRPDITILINGLPLAFIEVKKPNNQEGVLRERERINTRFKNKKFRKFINISQLLVFSNNMEYDQESIEPIQGAFYSSVSYKEANFNCFREENTGLFKILEPAKSYIEKLVLVDNNLQSIKDSSEFATNKNPESPTNRILTSLFSKNRLAFILHYGIVYVHDVSETEKHIMRYPQIFATLAIKNKLDDGIKKGIIWHTQGSGKTALAYFNVHFLTDYFQKKHIIPKFYFIVDRIDLMIQAKREFTMRGLIVHTVSSKEDLLKDFQSKQAVHNQSGKSEITVVNIQKFQDDPDIFKEKNYDINTQRVYFLDEVHRSYNPKGSFLTNLITSDRSAIHIGLTGTPLILKDKQSKVIFGDYIHKYYYNASIADGYTLRLIREEIETSYKIQLAQALMDIEIMEGDLDRRAIFSHEKFVEPMLDYIVQDFVKSRVIYGDSSIGAMVVCDSSKQARICNEIFNEKYSVNRKNHQDTESSYTKEITLPNEYGEYRNDKNIQLTGSLILHDEGSKDDRKQEVEHFKAGKIDFLFVYNMLLTGFDAKRLKKLYICRLIKDHNLLQTLTRVNRPYKKFRYGYVVDFADIKKEFDEVNRAYFEELQSELGDDLLYYSNLFKSKEEIEAEIGNIKEKLFHFDLANAETFSQQITKIEDRTKVLEIKKALGNARELYSIIRQLGHDDLLKKLDFKKLNLLYNETSRHLDLLNLKESVQNNVDTTNLLNVALENILFMFRKLSEKELIIADQLKDIYRKAREALGGNFDSKDAEFISLLEELKRLLAKKNLDEITQDEMKQNIDSLQQIYDEAAELNRKNDLLKAKYLNDAKYARVHKRILEKGNILDRESQIHAILMDIKMETDEMILKNNRILENESFFTQKVMVLVIDRLKKENMEVNNDTAKIVNSFITKEYLNEYQGVS